MRNIGRKSPAVRVLSAALAAVLVLAVMLLPGTGLRVQAASRELTSIGLAEHALKAYRDGWVYEYGAYGNFTSSGVRSSDCSGLVYSYLCWVDDSSNVKPNYSMPRGVNSQINASSVHGSIDTIPRTHGLILTYPEGSHVGVYVGNGMEVDNSTWGTNMVYAPISSRGWVAWHKLDCLTYPTEGWYLFDGDYFYYEKGEYVINTTRTIDGVTYTFGSDGVSDRKPPSAQNAGFASSVSDMNARVTGEGVRLRKGPGLNYDTLTYLSKNTAVNVTSTANAEWYAVTTGAGQKGYMSSQYIRLVGEVNEEKPASTAAPTDLPASDGKSAKTTTAVHLREGRGTDHASLGVIAAGTSITVTDTSDGTWYGVTVNGKSGYMHSAYIAMEGGTETPAATAVPTAISSDGQSAKTTAYVHLRDGRGTNYASLGVIPEGTSITVTDTSDGTWYGVTANGRSGYMHSDYIRMDGGTSASPAPSAGSSGVTGKTTAYVHLREGRGTTYGSLGVIPEGTSVTVTDTSDATWYGVTANGRSGYMHSDYIELAKAEAGQTAVTTADVNFREGPGTDKKVLTVLAKGTKVTVLDASDSAWYEVSTGGRDGYISANYLK